MKKYIFILSLFCVILCSTVFSFATQYYFYDTPMDVPLSEGSYVFGEEIYTISHEHEFEGYTSWVLTHGGTTLAHPNIPNDQWENSYLQVGYYNSNSARWRGFVWSGGQMTLVDYDYIEQSTEHISTSPESTPTPSPTPEPYITFNGWSETNGNYNSATTQSNIPNYFSYTPVYQNSYRYKLYNYDTNVVIKETEFIVHELYTFNVNITNYLSEGHYAIDWYKDNDQTLVKHVEIVINKLLGLSVYGITQNQVFKTYLPSIIIDSSSFEDLDLYVNGTLISSYHNENKKIFVTEKLIPSDVVEGRNILMLKNGTEIEYQVEFFVQLTDGQKPNVTDDNKINSGVLSDFDITDPTTWFTPIVKVFEKISVAFLPLSNVLTVILGFMPVEWLSIITFALALGVFLRFFGR